MLSVQQPFDHAESLQALNGMITVPSLLYVPVDGLRCIAAESLPMLSPALQFKFCNTEQYCNPKHVFSAYLVSMYSGDVCC